MAGAAPTAGAGVWALRTADLVYAAVAAVAAALALAEGPLTPLVVTCLLLALLPWALLAAGRDLPPGAFAVLAVAPVAPVVAQVGVGSALFLTTAAASWVASRSDRRNVVGATAAAVTLLPFLPYVLDDGARDVGSLYFAFGNLFGMLAGALIRRTRRLADELRAADVRLADAAAREERHRIARDVHDLVAHSLTVVVLHVGGARRVLRADPGAAEDALADAERVCRESLDGIRGVVGLLREDDGDRGVPSLDVQQLVEGYRAAGLPVVLRGGTDPESLPLLVRGTLHRVVQEALANAARHAGPPGSTAPPVPVEVTVEVTGGDPGAGGRSGAWVLARITNRLPSPSSTARRGPGGYGLLGLRERVAAVGGRLTGGPVGDAWVVECHLPLQRPEARADLHPPAGPAAGSATEGVR